MPLLQRLPGMQPPAQLAQEPPVGMLRGTQNATAEEEHQVLSTQRHCRRIVAAAIGGSINGVERCCRTIIEKGDKTP